VLDRARRLLEHRWAPALAGGLTALMIWWVWGSLHQVCIVHDEAAYVLQARLFASGRWTAAGPPLPEFFQQFHVLVTPVLASRYWPGHSLLMAPGVWLGLPGLVPLLLSGLTGALCFGLARRLAGPWVAALAWLFWTTAPANLLFRAGYFSEVTTGALWLLGWWALLNWSQTGRRTSLLTLAACVSWGAITRPLTMVAYAIPVAVVVLRGTRARHCWRDLGLAVGLGTAVLGLIPLWNARTMGDWRKTPYHLTFSFDLPPQLSELPPDMQRYLAAYHELDRAHTVAALPRMLRQRLQNIGDDMWHGWRAVLLPFAVLGVSAIPIGTGCLVATTVLLIVAHLGYPHHPGWSIYYLELQPIFAFVSALGFWVAASRVGAWRARRRLLGRRPAEDSGSLAVVLLCVAALPLCAQDVRRAQREHAPDRAYQLSFTNLVHQIPDPKAIVFVRYKPDHNFHWSLIVNEPDLERARFWIVYDRGPENARLMRLAPDRAAYRYDEATHTLTALPRPAASR
jgi:hypothetical protein